MNLTESLENISDLKLDAKNPGRHSGRNIKQISNSLEEFGAARSIVIDETGNILAGNGLVEAARVIGIKKLKVIESNGQEIIAVLRRGLSEKQKTEYKIADNRTAELAEWDIGVLGELAKEIDLIQFWSEQELGKLTPPVSLVEDDSPVIERSKELQKKWEVEHGQVWEIGPHRLMCGDSTVLPDVSLLLDGKKPFLMVTDPPYGVEYDPKWRLKAGLNKKWHTRSEGIVQNDTGSNWASSYKLFYRSRWLHMARWPLCR